jgi:hypothetical protein
MDEDSFRVTTDGPVHRRVPVAAYEDAVCVTCPAPHWPRLCVACSATRRSFGGAKTATRPATPNPHCGAG